MPDEASVVPEASRIPHVEASASWHARPSEAVADALGVSPEQGLDDDDVRRRHDRDGPNELVEQHRRQAGQILRDQVMSTMVLLLVGAATIKGVVAVVTGNSREWIDAGAIAAIVVINVGLGFAQEHRAERAMAALRRMAAPVVQMRRNGRRGQCAARDLVAGDVILLEAGSLVPADARLVSTAGLRVLEAALTGESVPVDKTSEPVAADAALGDRRSMVYLGTAVAVGRGTAVVVATGMRTELGRVAALLQDVRATATPLQRRVATLGAWIAVAVLAVIAAMVAVGIGRGAAPLDMVLSGVSVAVAAIPEGLPAVMTITLALGAQRMLSHRALIRRLPAVEALGSVTTICSDKTGTLTQNRMQVVVIDLADDEILVTDAARLGEPPHDAGTSGGAGNPDVTALLTVAVLCNDSVMSTASGPTPEATGDPTESALVLLAESWGLSKAAADAATPRIAEAPFTSERKRMTTVHRLDGGAAADAAPLWQPAHGAPYLGAVKGSADGLLALCSSVLTRGAIVPMSADYRARIAAAVDRHASGGLRVLGIAFRPLLTPDVSDVQTLERDLTFIGLLGLLDPPRPEARDAVARCRDAGIRPVMITGDHPVTALEIARQVGIATSGSTACTGRDLDGWSDDVLRARAAEVAVYARVAPEHKLRIVDALQRNGEVVAMTGDGVNDAPALRKADIGVAMGITGTDVAKEAADMVIVDDNFATIVRAVDEGRTIYDNVRKFVKYIVTSNSAEVAVMFLAQVAGMPMPMTTLQILWMNLVTDGVPGLALGLEPSEEGTMRRGPFAPGESVFSRGIGRHVVVMSALLTALAFGVGYWAWRDGRASWGTMVFVTLTLAQLGHALAVRSHRASIFAIGFLGNPLMLAAILITLALQIAVVYLPWAQAIFGTMPLSGTELAVCAAASAALFWAVELEKWLLRRFEPRHAG